MPLGFTINTPEVASLGATNTYYWEFYNLPTNVRVEIVEFTISFRGITTATDTGKIEIYRGAGDVSTSLVTTSPVKWIKSDSEALGVSQVKVIGGTNIGSFVVSDLIRSVNCTLPGYAWGSLDHPIVVNGSGGTPESQILFTLKNNSAATNMTGLVLSLNGYIG